MTAIDERGTENKNWLGTRGSTTPTDAVSMEGADLQLLVQALEKHVVGVHAAKPLRLRPRDGLELGNRLEERSHRETRGGGGGGDGRLEGLVKGGRG